MCKIKNFLKKELTFCGADIKNKEALFLYLSENIEKIFGISKETVLKNITERESYGSTGIGKGVAVPHCKIAAAKEIIVQIVSFKNPIPYDGPDGQDVKLAFMLIVPEGNNLLYLKLVSQISILCSDPNMREALFAAKTPEEIIDLISKFQAGEEPSKI